MGNRHPAGPSVAYPTQGLAAVHRMPTGAHVRLAQVLQMRPLVRAYWRACSAMRRFMRQLRIVQSLSELTAYIYNEVSHEPLSEATLPPPDLGLKYNTSATYGKQITVTGRQPMMWAPGKPYAKRKRKK